MLILLIFCQAFGQTPSPPPKKVYEWPVELSQYVNKRGNQVLYAGANAIFESLSAVTTYFPISPTFGVGVSAQRRVYETREISNPWVIEDHFQIKFPISYQWKDVLHYALKTAGVNAGLMITPGVEWIHFRDTKRSQYSNLPTLTAQKESLEKSDWYQNLIAKHSQKKSNLPVEETKDKEQRKNFWDPSVRPRFSKILNPLTIPFRLPFHADHLSSLSNEEVFVYRGSGTVEVKLGVSVPLVNLIPGIDLEAGANVRGYFGGDYRVAIMKENARYAKVRVAWSKGGGSGVDAGVQAQGSVPIASWLGINLAYHPRIKPIQITDDQIIQDLTDWSFRYDLENPKARAAFDSAVLGLLGDSQDIIDLERDLPESEKSVTLISHREAKQISKVTGENGALEFLIDAWKRRTLIFSDIDSELKDGTHKILKWESHHQKEVRRIGGAFTDTSRFTYTVLLDYLNLSLGKPNAYGIIAEGFLVDYYTYGSELNQKIELIQQLVGETDLIKKLPEKLENASHRLKRTMYGRTSFYFGYNLTQSQVDLILNANPEKVKAIFKGVFPNRPRLARQSYRRWLRAHDERVLKERLDLLSKLLNLKSKSNEFMKAFQMILADETIDIFVNIYTQPTGRVEQRKNVVSDIDQLRVRSEPGINIEQLVLRFGGDLSAQIKSMHVTPGPEATGVLELDLAAKPKLMYFEIIRSGAFTFSDALFKGYFSNDAGTIKQGLNTIHIDIESDETIGSALALGLKPNANYTILVAYSIDGMKWGQVSKSSFLTRR